jgi:hypothetical protein
MYALLALASSGLLAGLLRRLEEGRGAWQIALWTGVGLLTHYHFLYVVAALGAALLALPRLDPRYGPGRRRALAALGAGAALVAPWFVLAFPDQVAHGLPPGGSKATLLRLGEGLKNLVFSNVSVGSQELRWIGLAASGAMLLLALSGLCSSYRARRTGAPVALPVLSAALLFGAPLLTWIAAKASARAGFEWRYILGALPALCLLFGSEACASGGWHRLRRAGVWTVGACALLVAVPNARDGGGEGYRDAVAWILAHAGAEDAVVAADWQPGIFPQGLGWDYYARRSAIEPPSLLAVTDTFSIADPEALAGHPRVFCCLRSLPPECALLRTLRAHYTLEEVHPFGRSVFVHAFAGPRDAGESEG